MGVQECKGLIMKQSILAEISLPSLPLSTFEDT